MRHAGVRRECGMEWDVVVEKGYGSAAIEASDASVSENHLEP